MAGQDDMMVIDARGATRFYGRRVGIRGIDLTRIESRPTRTGLGSYIFFLDCAGHVEDSAIAEALKALHRRCAEVRYLGSWPTGDVIGAAPPNSDEAERWLARLREGST